MVNECPQFAGSWHSSMTASDPYPPVSLI